MIAKRNKATAKPARRYKAKRRPTKKTKSKVRRANTKLVTDAHVQLEVMSLDERIAAVADDVASKRDEYRSINPHELASLLGVDASHPDGHWNFVWFVPRVPVECILAFEDDECIPELLKTHVTAKKREEISAKIKILKRDKVKLPLATLDFLTKKEMQTVERLYMEDEARKNGAMWTVAYYVIKAPQRRKLCFEALIEDDGGCIHLLTPYDERDGNFTNFSDCLIVS